MTNEERASYIRTTIPLYASMTKQEGDHDIVIIRDILTDMMHFCREDRIDFSRQLADAQDHFKEEVREENGDI